MWGVVSMVKYVIPLTVAAKSKECWSLGQTTIFPSRNVILLIACKIVLNKKGNVKNNCVHSTGDKGK